MDLRQLRYFVAIADYGSLTKAATHLRIAQPALSLQISNLEKDLRSQLLNRSPRGVTLTESGRILYRHSRLILRQLEQAREEIQVGTVAASGLVAIGLPTTVTAPLAMPLVRAVREQYPSIRMQLFESLSGYLSELLANNRLDFAVLFREAETRTISVTPVLRESLHLVGTCGLTNSDRKKVDFDLIDLHRLPLVLPSTAHDLRLTVERSCARAGFEANIVADIDSPRTAIAIAAENIACTILPLSALLSAKETIKDLQTRLIVSPEITRVMSLCRLNTSAQSPASVAVEKVIRALIPRLVADGAWPGVTLMDSRAVGR